MSEHIHLDEARAAAVAALLRRLGSDARIERAAIVDDLFGMVRVILWSREDIRDAQETLQQELRDGCGAFWSGDLWICKGDVATPDRALFDAAWTEGAPVAGSGGRLRLTDRHRSRTAWFLPVERMQPIWPPAEGPPVIVFHSFKGGVGRTTGLAAYAIARARRRDRVAVVDVDLDAPGVGRLLDVDGEGTAAGWGVVDYLLESRVDLPLTDYYHTCAREAVTGEGSVQVFPAGRLDDDYLTKLARVDLEVGVAPLSHPLPKLLRRIRDELKPDVILLDGRAGLSPAAGLVLGGFSHLNVLFATTSQQSLIGLERVVHRLGADRARLGVEQGECLVVQALVPDSAEIGAAAQAEFAARVEDIFRYNYYASERDDKDQIWSLDDLTSSDAPHVPTHVTYRGALAHFRTIDQVADLLATDRDYKDLADRIDARAGVLRRSVRQEI